MYQWFATDGRLFYSNAYDETTYLTFEISQITQSFTRTSQYIVSMMHETGLSGGEINFIFDLFCPLVFFILVAKIFVELKYEKFQSYLAALITISVPILFGRSNPIYSSLFDLNILKGTIQWVTLPEAYYPPIFRSPEPQFSLVLISLSVLISLKRNSFIPLYLVVPFLYPFVRIPFMFIVISLHLLENKNIATSLNKLLSIPIVVILSYTIVSLFIFFYYQILIEGTFLDEFLIKSRVPLISFSGLICLLSIPILNLYVNYRFKYFLLIVALSPLIAVNTQFISGVIAQPNNYEQNYGTICISLFLAFGVISALTKPWVKSVAIALTTFLILIYTKIVFDINSPVQLHKPLPSKLIKLLEKDSSKVIIENAYAASAFNLVLPKQKITAISEAQNSFVGIAEVYFDNFLCMQTKYSKDNKLFPNHEKVFNELREGYRHLHSNFILAHINRKNSFTTFFNPDDLPKNCDEGHPYFNIIEN